MKSKKEFIDIVFIAVLVFLVAWFHSTHNKGVDKWNPIALEYCQSRASELPHSDKTVVSVLWTHTIIENVIPSGYCRYNYSELGVFENIQFTPQDLRLWLITDRYGDTE